MEENVTKKCKYCQTEIDKQAKICPNCKKKQSHTARNVILGIIAFIILCAMILSGDSENTTQVSTNNTNNTTSSTEQNNTPSVSTNNTASSTEENNNKGTNTTTKQEKLSVVDHSTTNDGYWTYIVGTVKNNTNRNYSYVQVEINLYDADGNLVNSTLDNINNLEANGTWKFKALVTDKDFATYKIKEVTGW